HIDKGVHVDPAAVHAKHEDQCRCNAISAPAEYKASVVKPFHCIETLLHQVHDKQDHKRSRQSKPVHFVQAEAEQFTSQLIRERKIKTLADNAADSRQTFRTEDDAPDTGQPESSRYLKQLKPCRFH